MNKKKTELIFGNGDICIHKCPFSVSFGPMETSFFFFVKLPLDTEYDERVKFVFKNKESIDSVIRALNSVKKDFDFLLTSVKV